MTLNTQHTDTPELLLDEALRHPHRRGTARRRFGWCLVGTCALLMGIILASDPKVSEAIASKVSIPGMSGTDKGSVNAQVPVGGTSDLPFPMGTLTSVNALSNSIRAAMGGGSPSDRSVQTNAEMDDPAVKPQGTQSETSNVVGGFFSFGSGASDNKPIVSSMPQNRIPVRRAGMSNK